MDVEGQPAVRVGVWVVVSAYVNVFVYGLVSGGGGRRNVGMRKYAHTHTQTPTRRHTQARTYTHTHTNTQIHAHKHARIATRTGTHFLSLSRFVDRF